MAHATPHSLFKAAMKSQLEARAGLAPAKVSYDPPTDAEDVRATGSNEAIWFQAAEGSAASILLCAGNLHFDYDYAQPCVVQVLRPESTGTQQRADERLEELLYEVLAELSSQQSWALATLGLNVFDFFQAIPQALAYNVGFLPGGAGHGARCTVDIRVQARRSFS